MFFWSRRKFLLEMLDRRALKDWLSELRMGGWASKGFLGLSAYPGFSVL